MERSSRRRDVAYQIPARLILAAGDVGRGGEDDENLLAHFCYDFQLFCWSRSSYEYNGFQVDRSSLPCAGRMSFRVCVLFQYDRRCVLDGKEAVVLAGWV